jgi:hypothetical protein
MNAAVRLTVIHSITPSRPDGATGIRTITPSGPDGGTGIRAITPSGPDGATGRHVFGATALHTGCQLLCHRFDNSVAHVGWRGCDGNSSVF